jgi:C4-dicarboxylate-specific signal transduction histidine kinase
MRELTDGLDVAARQAERRRQEMQLELAHANRLATIGQLWVSVAHEVNENIAAAVTNADAALHWLEAQPPSLDKARQALGRILENGHRASGVIAGIGSLVHKQPPRIERLEINNLIAEVIGLTTSERVKSGASIRMELAEGLTPIEGDRVQLQQVMLNLIINAVEAMSPHAAGARDLLIRTAKTKSGGVLVTVRDSGPGVDPAILERIFDAYFTTKADGSGMGLSICRAIIQAHGGRLSATRGAAGGTILQFTLPAGTDSAS